MLDVRLSLFVLVCWLLFGPLRVQAQFDEEYDPSWYDPDAPYVQIDVTADGVYRVEASALTDALPDGTTLADISPETIRLLENGQEIPIQLDGADDGRLDGTDTITFVGHRNRGDDELWAYDGDRSAQNSTYHSLYSDTTTYWMTWGGDGGLRYAKQSSPSASVTSALRDTVHAERDNLYYFGRPDKNGNSRYTESEGYYWKRFTHNDTSPITFRHTLAVGRRTETSTELDLAVHLDAATNSCHRVEVEAKLRQSSASPAFESFRTVEWEGFQRRTIQGSIAQDRIPDEGLELRLTSYNDNFSDDGCPDPASRPNQVLFDWIEAAYTRSLEASDNVQRFVAPTTQQFTFELSGHSGSTVHVYNPSDARRFEAPVTNGTATVTDAPSTAPTPYWAIGNGQFRTPTAIRPDAPSNWSVPSAHGADYLILTTKALLPSARKLADYRRSHDGYQVEVATVQNVFDEFDYGRPTPIAIRRFARAARDWAPEPRFLTIFGDAQYPIDDGSVASLYPEWSVPSFGFAPSDGWFAMQTEGPEDWSEFLAVGRIPVRSVAQGDLFIEKLKTYEEAPLERWQKRTLLLAGGTNDSEQSALQRYSNWWGEIASDTTANTRGYTGPVYTGADTLRYYKEVNDALDASFQDSLSVDLKRGAGWLNYFGHSGATTWEIVTDRPSEFDNAERLPIVSSIGCRTGAFAGGRFEEKSEPSLGEQIVVGSVRPDGTPREGSMNGGIAHFGESALGFRVPSARLNDALIQRVFVDTMRVLGEAIRSAKADIAAEFGNSDFFVKHLLQYGLLGDPATNVAIPDKPDLHVAPNLISISPDAPTPSDNLTVEVQVQSRGLIPSDSVDVRLAWEKPGGAFVRRSRRVQRISRQRTLQFSFPLDEQAIGTNAFRVTVDPENTYDEVIETNNTTEKSQVVFRSGVELISPADQGVVRTRRPNLQFSVPRQAAASEAVTLQLDSVPSFDSPARREVTRGSGTISATWTPDRALRDSTTYYWRGRLEERPEAGWQQSSFTVRPNRAGEGWVQQNRLFQRNQNDRVSWTPQSEWTFQQFNRDIFIASERGSGNFKGVIKIDGVQRFENLTLGFGIVTIDGTSGRVKKNESFCTYDVSDRFLNEGGPCGGGVDGEEAADLLETFLRSVDEGDYVLVRTRHLANSGSATISDRVKRLFRTLGGSSASAPHTGAIDTLTYNDLWTLQAQKGRPAQTTEQVSDETNEITQRTEIAFSRPRGQTLTPRIGPVSEWDSLRWRATGSSSASLAIDVLSADTSRVLARAEDMQGALALDNVDPASHPFLRLRATLTDSTARVPPQLQRWSVSYTGVPELAVDPSGLQSVADTLRQGEDVTVSLPIANLGSVASTPLRVDYSLTDASNSTISLESDTLQGLPPGARDTSSIQFSTTNRPGANVLTTTTETDGPPERITNNNTAVRNFFVQKDRTPPALTVLANGREIPATPDPVNNLQDPSLPFLSTEPSIEILLQDDNPNLSLADTSNLEVFLKGGLPRQGPSLISDFRRISYSSNELTLVPSDSGASNTVRARFEPTLRSQDSTYTMKVEANDSQGNEIEPYQATFRVQNEQVVRDVYPYPNPMNTHTTFAFRVEGGMDEMLRDFTLRIYTLSGRLIRELNRRDLETPLSVGWNKVKWNGRDADGDEVGTGVYLYRVRVEGDDQTFRGDVEKVTVIR